MATLLVAGEEADSCQFQYGNGADALYAIINPYDYTTTYPLDALFPSMSGGAFFQPGRIGDGLLADVSYQQVFLIRNFTIKLIAGVFGTCGFRDGLGSQAVFGIGGLQGLTYGTCRGANGDLYISDFKNGKIRKLHENPNGTWTVSTHANYSTNGMTIDGSDNIWVSNGSSIAKIAPNGAVTNYGHPDGNIIGLSYVDGLLYSFTRNSSWDVISSFNPSNSVVTRLGGMLETEIDAYKAAHNGAVLVDGAAIGEATFHSVGIGYIGPNGNEIVTGGGDERQVRRIINGRVESLLGTGVWQESQDRVTAAHSDPNRPYYMSAPAGKNLVTGYPWRYSFNFDFNSGTVFKAISQITTGPGAANDSSFVSQSIPSTMIAGQQYSVTITMHNAGSGAWSEATNHHLGSQNPQDNSTFNWNRAYITGTISAGSDYAFTFQVRAPATPGQYNFQTRMVQDAVEWFGAFSPNVVVTVNPATNPTVIPGGILIRL